MGHRLRARQKLDLLSAVGSRHLDTCGADKETYTIIFHDAWWPFKKPGRRNTG